MTARRLFPTALTVLAALVAVAPLAQAAAADVPTEEAERVSEVRPAGDYDELESSRCEYDVVDDDVEVACRASGTLWLEYEVEVPRQAINLRSSVSRTFAEDSTGRYLRSDGARTDATTYLVTVSVARGTAATIGPVRVRYDLPTQVDDRDCVTTGEWQAVNVAKGGSGGTLRRVAEVFDHRGVREERSAWSSGYRYQVRAYPRCDSERQLRITFHEYRDQRGWHSYWG